MFSLNHIQKSLSLPDFDPVPAQLQMAPLARVLRRPPNQAGTARQGAVLLLLYCRHDQIHLVLTKRPDTLNDHAGQVAFPGGRQHADETLEMAALRETFEEIGVESAGIRLLGTLTTIYIPVTDYEVHPFVGWFNGNQAPIFHPNPTEVAELLEVPLQHFWHSHNRVEETWQFRGADVRIPLFQFAEHKIWGATAIILNEFIERLKTVSKS